MFKSERQSDETERDLTEQDLPNSQEKREKRGYLRESSEKGKKDRGQADLPRQQYRERLQKEHKLGTGKDRMSQRMRSNQKIRTYFQSQYEAEVEHFSQKLEEASLNGLAWRGVCSQNS